MNPTPVEILTTRANAGVDPTLAAWTWEIPGYLFLGGLVAGLMILLAALELRRPGTPGPDAPRPTAARWMPLVAAGLLSVGMLLLLLDLANPGNVLRFYTSFQPASPMSWGSWLLLLVYPVLAMMFLGGLDEARRQRLLAWRPVTALRLGGLLRWAIDLGTRRRRVWLWSSLALGVALAAYTGLLLGTLSARPLWHGAALPALFLASGISTAAALMLLTRLDDRTSHTLVRWDVAAIVAELALLGALLLGLVTGSTASQAAAGLLLGGAYTATFWALVILAGLLVPLALNVLELRGRVPRTLAAPALVLVGGLALRAILVSAGQASSVAVAAL